MAEYIDREALLAELDVEYRSFLKLSKESNGDSYALYSMNGISIARRIIIKQDSTPVAPAVYGEWIKCIGYWPWKCSRCKTVSYDRTPYCQNCGAKMDEVHE